LEIGQSFLNILAILTVIFSVGRVSQLVDLVINKGLDLQDIGRLVLYLMPSLLVFTNPDFLLFAILPSQ
jgi:lipopolysaccharide export LptBFGC system permease protein LptF